MKTLSIKKSSNLKKQNVSSLPATKLSRKGSVDRSVLILEAREPAKKIARTILARWSFRIEDNELRSLVDFALCDAARLYNPKGGSSFLTYSFFFIKGELYRHMRAEFLAAKTLESRQASFDSEDDGLDAISKVPDDSTPSPEACFAANELRRECAFALSALEVKERTVVLENLIAGEKMPLVARRLGLSRGYSFMLRASAIKKVKESLSHLPLAA